MTANKRKKQVTGKKGEQLAVGYLELAGYQILERNWRSGRTEIDLIADKGSVLHFIEVKARRSRRYGWPEEYITRRKVTRMIKAAEAYLETLHILRPAQLDVLSILLSEGEPPVFWLIEDVFD